MATSKTDICNKALTLIGAAPIVNLTDDSTNAQAINRVYEMSLRSILSETPWVFALRRELLAQSADTLAWYDTGNTIMYVKPNQMIRPFRSNSRKATWTEHGEYIVSDTTGLGLEFVYYHDVPSKYSSSFVEAFVDKLASDLAFIILNSKTIAQSSLEKYEQVSLAKALAENSQVGTPKVMEDDAWDLAKLGSNNIVPGQGD